MRILLVTSRFPLPPWRGNQVRTLQWLRALGEHELTVLAPCPGQASRVERLRLEYGARVVTYPLSPAASALGAAGALIAGRPAQEGLFHGRAGRAALGKVLHQEEWDLAIVQMVRCWWALEELERWRPGVPVLFDAIDAMGLHFGRAGEIRRGPLGLVTRLEARRCRVYEREMASRAAVTTAVAPRDLAALGAPGDRGRVVPVAAAPRAPARLGAARTVLLSGNLGYRPARQGAMWFAAEVWPRLRQRHPEVRWVLAGARPPSDLRRLARFPGVEVHGDVPDLAPHLAAARVAIAPMAGGSGVPMKVLEAWACGLPVVAHPWAAAGLMGGNDAVAVAEGAQQWVDTLDGLLRDDAAAERLGRRGLEAWDRFYRPERVEAAVREAVYAVLTGLSPGSGRLA